MGSTQLRTGWSTLVQALVDSEGQGLRARILLECVAREPWVQACGLWRREKRADEWTCLLARGAPELLPGQCLLSEVAAGRTPADLLSGRGLLIAGHGEGALALTYAGIPELEADLDLLSGLLHVARLADAAESRDGGARVEAFVPALPRTPAAPRGRPREAQQDCQPAALLSEVCDAERAPCARSRIPLECELEPGAETCRVALHGPEFVRAVRNLIANAREALEHTQEGGRIRVSLRRSAEARLLLVGVEDTGPGLPSAVLQALRARGPEDLPGPGLGLAVAWGIVLGAGGRLRVAESSENGTRIELLLPLAAAS